MTQIHQISEDTLSQAYALMSEERRLRCDRLRTDSEKRACICGDMLIRKLAKEHFDLNEKEVILCADSNGKPFIKDAPYHVSISHSGDLVLCAISHYPVGVDIQKVEKVPEKIVQKIDVNFDSDRQFYEYWTAAESYGKLFGNGIWWALKQDFLNDNDCRFESIPCPDGYIATICIKR